jgi:pyridoxine 4-dehydrogenase
MSVDLAGRSALGCAGFSFSPVPEDDSVAVIRAAYDSGIRVFDTARAYAPVGDATHNERILARALAGRADAIVGTKGGHWRTDSDTFAVDNRPERLRQDVKTSLRALGAERLDLLFLHRADLGDVPIEDSVGGLEELRREGKIARIGVSNVTPDQLRRGAAVAPIAVVQNRLPLRSDPGRNTVLSACEELGIAYFGHAVVTAYPLDADMRPLPESLPRLAEIARAREVPIVRLAARGLLAASPVITLIVGSTRIETAVETARIPGEPWDAEAQAAYDLDRAKLPDWKGLLYLADLHIRRSTV